MRNHLYIDVVHDAYNGKVQHGLVTTLITSRWRIPVHSSDLVADIVDYINEYQDKNDGLRLFYPDEGYSCTVEAQAEECISCIMGHLHEDMEDEEYEDSRYEIRGILDMFFELLRYLELQPVPETTYINITLTNE